MTNTLNLWGIGLYVVTLILLAAAAAAEHKRKKDTES